MAIKRFYTEATVAAGDDGFRISLDGRPLRTPAKSLLTLPARPLAEAIASEWRAQQDEIDATTMPMMQLASTAIDRIAPRRDTVVDEIAGYAGTDLLCYRAEAPAKLVERQAATWQPVLDWAALELDAALTVTAGVIPVCQPETAVAAVRRAVSASDDFVLAGLHGLTMALGSVVLALALRDGRIDAEAACAASFLDEDWQAELWGRDADAEARRARISGEIHATARFFVLL